MLNFRGKYHLFFQCFGGHHISPLFATVDGLDVTDLKALMLNRRGSDSLQQIVAGSSVENGGRIYFSKFLKRKEHGWKKRCRVHSQAV